MSPQVKSLGGALIVPIATRLPQQVGCSPDGSSWGRGGGRGIFFCVVFILRASASALFALPLRLAAALLRLLPLATFLFRLQFVAPISSACSSFACGVRLRACVSVCALSLDNACTCTKPSLGRIHRLQLCCRYV